MYMHIIVKQIYWYISQVSVYRTIGPLVIVNLGYTGVYDFSSPEPKAQVELIVWYSSRRPSVCPSVRVFTFSKIFSETAFKSLN